MTYPTESFAGAATPTHITATFSASAMSGTFHDLSTWTELGTNDPLGTSGDFVITVDYGKTSEEKIRCSALDLNTGVITFVERGFDDTTPAVHSAGLASKPNCFPVLSASDMVAVQEEIAVARAEAQAAQNDATEALSDASDALSAASTAQSTANTALSNAATAQSTANTAETHAQTAITNAATAQSTANSKVASVSAGNSTVTIGGTSTSPTVAVTPNTFDPYGAAASKVASVRAADGTITVAGTSTAPTVKVNTLATTGVYNVKSYGALGNGSTDDTAAIQAAINAAQTSGGEVYFPVGNYLTTATLTISSRAVSLVGAVSLGVNNGVLITPSNNSFTWLDISNVNYATEIRDIQFKTFGTSGTSTAIQIVNCQNVQISNVVVSNCFNGFLVQSGGVVFDNININPINSTATGRYGFLVSGLTGNPNSTVITNSVVSQLNNTNKNTVDAYVLADRYNSLTLNNCAALNCNIALWSKVTTSTAPNFLVTSQFVSDHCVIGVQLDRGYYATFDQMLITSSQGSISGANGFVIGASYDGGPVQISNSVIQNSTGGVKILGGTIVDISNLILLNISQPTVSGGNYSALELSGSASVFVNGLYASMASGAATGTVNLDSTFSGYLSLADFQLKNNYIGIYVDSSNTGVYHITNGKIDTSSVAGGQFNSIPTNAFVAGVTGVTNVGTIPVGVLSAASSVHSPIVDSPLFYSTSSGNITLQKGIGAANFVKYSDNNAINKGSLLLNNTYLQVQGALGLSQARYIGSTTSGAPTSTSFAYQAGDLVVDKTGKIWICTVSGSPGTWIDSASLKVASVTAADGTITVAGTATAPTVKVGTVPYAQLSGTPSSLPPSGSAGGDLTGSYPNPTLAALSPSPAGTFGSSTKMPVITVDAKGRITSASEITPATDAPSGPAGGDLSGTYPNPSVVAGSTTQAGKLQLTDSTSSISTTTAATPNAVKTAYDLASTANSAAATAQSTANAKVASVTAADTTITIAGTATAPTVAVGTVPYTQVSGGPTSLPPSGSAGGDLTGSYPNPTLAAVGTAGTYGSASVVPVITTDSKGRITGVSNTNIAISALAASAQQDLYVKQAVRTASATITNNEVAMFDTTAGALTCTLPSLTSRGQIAVVLTAGTNALTINAPAGVTINGSLSSIQLTAAGQAVRMVMYQSGNAYYIIGSVESTPGGSGFTLPANVLSSSTGSTSTTLAATPSAVKSAYDLANTALQRSGGTMSGTITMGTNRITGLAAPGAVGDALRAGDFSNNVGPRFHLSSFAVPVLAWTVEPQNAGQATAPTSNRTYWQAIYIPYQMTVTGALFAVSTVGATITSSSIGLYDSTGTRLVQQSNANAGFGTALTGTVTVAFSTTYAITTPGVYWIGFHVAATTTPTLIRAQSGNAAAVNFNISATAGSLNFRSGYSGTGAIPASFPAGTPTLDVGPWLFGLY